VTPTKVHLVGSIALDSVEEFFAPQAPCSAGAYAAFPMANRAAPVMD